MNSDDTTRPDVPRDARGDLPTEIIAPQPTAPAARQHVATEQPQPEAGTIVGSKRSTARPIVIGAAVGAGVLLIGAVAFGAASALTGPASFAVVPAAVVTESGEAVATDAADDSAGRAAADAAAANAAAAEAARQAAESALGSAGDPAALVQAVDVAVAAAQGSGASAVEVESDGWKVDVVLPDGSEVDVRVAFDGTATVRADQRDDDSDPVIDPSRIPGIAAAAIGAAGDGVVISIESDGTQGFDVTVRTGAGAEVDVELAVDLTVREIDRG